MWHERDDFTIRRVRTRVNEMSGPKCLGRRSPPSIAQVPSASCAQTLSTPEGRAEPRGRSAAESVDDGEHSLMLKCAMDVRHVSQRDVVLKPSQIEVQMRPLDNRQNTCETELVIRLHPTMERPEH